MIACELGMHDMDRGDGRSWQQCKVCHAIECPKCGALSNLHFLGSVLIGCDVCRLSSADYEEIRKSVAAAMVKSISSTPDGFLYNDPELGALARALPPPRPWITPDDLTSTGLPPVREVTEFNKQFKRPVIQEVLAHRAMGLADRCQTLEDENTKLNAENGRLRRQVEKLEKKGKR